MEIVRTKISLATLNTMADKMFSRLVKAVVDVEKEIMAVDADLHADQEELLLEDGSDQKNLWGINLHPDKFNTEGWIEYDSMINLRPSWGNKTRSVDDPKIREKIVNIINKLVEQ